MQPRGSRALKVPEGSEAEIIMGYRVAHES